jgi:hypothetical protein
LHLAPPGTVEHDEPRKSPATTWRPVPMTWVMREKLPHARHGTSPTEVAWSRGRKHLSPRSFVRAARGTAGLAYRRRRMKPCGDLKKVLRGSAPDEAYRSFQTRSQARAYSSLP